MDLVKKLLEGMTYKKLNDEKESINDYFERTKNEDRTVQLVTLMETEDFQYSLLRFGIGYKFTKLLKYYERFTAAKLEKKQDNKDNKYAYVLYQVLLLLRSVYNAKLEVNGLRKIGMVQGYLKECADAYLMGVPALWKYGQSGLFVKFIPVSKMMDCIKRNLMIYEAVIQRHAAFRNKTIETLALEGPQSAKASLVNGKLDKTNLGSVKLIDPVVLLSCLERWSDPNYEWKAVLDFINSTYMYYNKIFASKYKTAKSEITAINYHIGQNIPTKLVWKALKDPLLEKKSKNKVISIQKLIEKESELTKEAVALFKKTTGLTFDYTDEDIIGMKVTPEELQEMISNGIEVAKKKAEEIDKLVEEKRQSIPKIQELSTDNSFNKKLRDAKEMTKKAEEFAELADDMIKACKKHIKLLGKGDVEEHVIMAANEFYESNGLFLDGKQKKTIDYFRQAEAFKDGLYAKYQKYTLSRDDEDIQKANGYLKSYNITKKVTQKGSKLCSELKQAKSTFDGLMNDLFKVLKDKNTKREIPVIISTLTKEEIRELGGQYKTNDVKKDVKEELKNDKKPTEVNKLQFPEKKLGRTQGKGKEDKKDTTERKNAKPKKEEVDKMQQQIQENYKELKERVEESDNDDFDFDSQDVGGISGDNN